VDGDQIRPDDVVRALPGTGDIMASVGRCFGDCWHAARKGNFELAAYFLRRTRSQLRKLTIVRPKYAQQVTDFDREYLAPLYTTLMERDVKAFAETYKRAVERANYYHVDTGHPYIHWHAPNQMSDSGIDFNPR
jgi:hypothetical protein